MKKGKTKAQMLRHLVIKHGHESKREKTCRTVRVVIHEAWVPLMITAGRAYFCGGVLTLLESQA